MSELGEPPFELVIRRPITLEAKQWLEDVRQMMWTPEMKKKFEDTHEEIRKIWMDEIVYGKSYYETLPDGTIKHIPFHEAER
jgi:hypothetical protein